MKRSRILVLFAALSVCVSLAAAEPDYLIRATRQCAADRNNLLDAGVPVVMDLSGCLLVMGGKADLDALAKRGFETSILDTSPSSWDYYHVGLRPDSNIKALTALGTVLLTEENWVILRVAPGADLSRLYDAKVFIAKVPHERLEKPRPLPQGTPAAMSRPPGPEHVVPLVQQMVNSVVNADIMSYWTGVVPPNPPGTGTRYSTTTGCTDAATNIFNIYNGLGLSPQYQNYQSGYAPNTIGTITGAVTPDKVYIIIGHLDDMPSSGYAPGGDDNASGVVAGLEAAKIMSCYAFKNTVKFIACTGEEQGLYGSTAYANDAASRTENIQGVIAFDMPGWEGDGTPVPENLDLNYNTGIPGSQALGQLFAACATDYGTGLVVDAFNCPSLDASDHYPFWQHNWAAVCGITDNEGYCGHNGTYPVYHTSNDTIAACGNPAFFYSAVKATLATLAELGEPFKITLDKTSYGCSVPVTIVVGDKDLNTNASTVQTTTIQVWSTRESTPESVILTEQGVNSMIFKGIINLTGSAPVHGDGLLSVNPGDTITARYIDALDCNGSTNVTYDATGTVSADCTGPVITNVLVTNLTDTTATVTWTTDESANSRVTYGTSKPPGTIKDDLTTYVTSHSVTLTGLSACTPYFFSVYSEDAVGNATTDNNGGMYYSFTTAARSFAMGPDTVEGGVLSWVATGTAGALWHQDTCQSHSATHAWKAGAAQGTCPGTYVATADTYLTWNANITLGAAGHGYHLRFWENYTTESGYDYCHPQVSTDGGTNWTDLASYAGTGAWAQKDYDLAAYTGATVRFRFWFHSDSSQNYEGWYVDDIEVSKSQGCSADPRYQSLSRTDVCGAGGAGNNNGILDPGEDSVVTITMVNGGMAAATTVSATLSTSTPGITVTDNSATFPNIAANGGTGVSQPNHFSVHVDSGIACGTVANFTLHAVCAEVPSGVDSGFTMTVGQAGGTITDMSQNFTSVTPPALPAGWTVSHTSGNDWLTSASYYCGAANGLYYPYNSSQAANSWAYTPSMTLTAGVTYTLNFNQKVQSATFPEALEVKAGTAATPAGQTIMIWTQTGLVNTTCTARAPTFTVPSTGTYYLSFHCTSAADEYYLIVDDISLTHVQAPSCTVCTCTAPGAPNLTAATGDCNGVNLTWTAGTGTTNSYNAYRSTNTTCPVGTLTKLNASPIPSGTLSYADTTAVAGTTYTYVVRGACDAGGTTESVNSNCRAAARLAVPAAPAAPTFTGVGQTSITVNWSAVGGATNYDVWRQTGASCTGASKITASPVAGLSYADNTVTCGNTYSYFVTANNTCGASANGACNTQATSACASAPKPVPDGRLGGTPMKVTIAGFITYDATTCPVPDHSIIFGSLANVSTVTPSGGVCSIGNTGSYSWTSIPAGNIWFVMVGDSGTTESSWGQKYVGGSYSQRSASASNQCGNTTIDVSGTCP